MKKFLSAACLIFALAPAALSIEPTQWQYRQSFEVAQAGPLRISVPLETLGQALPDLRDLRILGPDGEERPYVILDVPTERPAYKGSRILDAASGAYTFSVTMEGDKTVFLIDNIRNTPIHRVFLAIADETDYTKPARVEVSNNKESWSLVAKGVPLFRRGSARGEQDFQQNTVPVEGRSERYIRITIFNQGRDESPIAIRGALLYAVDEIAARAGIPDEDTPVKIVSMKQTSATIVSSTVIAAPSVPRSVVEDIERARTGQVLNSTQLILDLGAANVSLTQLHFDVADTLFIRGVSVIAYPLDAKGNLTLPAPGLGRNGSIYCIKDIDGTPMRSNTTLELGGLPILTRMIMVNIANGDSPPLHILGVSAKRRPVHIAFNPPAARRYTLLSGNAQADAPRYDLAAFSENLGRLPVTQITAFPIEPTPDYRAPAPKPSDGEPLNLATRAIFWVALALVVILLLVVVAKLLPKPKE